MEFCERLVELRKERGATREDFAEYLGISKYTLRNYELGKTEPGHVFLKFLADVFKVSVDYLLCMTDDRTPPNKTPIYSKQELDHLKKYTKLDSHGQKIVDLVLDEEYSRCENAASDKKYPDNEPKQTNLKVAQESVEYTKE